LSTSDLCTDGDGLRHQSDVDAVAAAAAAAAAGAGGTVDAAAPRTDGVHRHCSTEVARSPASDLHDTRANVLRR